MEILLDFYMKLCIGSDYSYMQCYEIFVRAVVEITALSVLFIINRIQLSSFLKSVTVVKLI
jgi:uncharacterized membrane protein